MKNSFYELIEKLFEFFLVVATSVRLAFARTLLFVYESAAWFKCQLDAGVQLAKDDSGQFDNQQPRCSSGRHERYLS